MAVMITPYIKKTVRVLQHRKEKLEHELKLASSALAGLTQLSISVPKTHAVKTARAKRKA